MLVAGDAVVTVGPRKGPHRGQMRLFAIMLGVYVLAAAAYIVVPGGALDPTSAPPGSMPVTQMTQLPVWQLILGNACMILVLYGALGLAGYWFSRRSGLPGFYRAGAGLVNWLLRPLEIGAVAGIVLVAGDQAMQRLFSAPPMQHPRFPASILASLAAGIGEEILTRLFVMSLWAFILTWALGRLFPGRQTRPAALFIANVLGALAFAASHLPAAMVLGGVASPADLPVALLVEIVLLNGMIGLLAGAAMVRDGLVAASGIHFWADIVWHVVYVLIG